jgi:hypothetical protein
MRGKRKFLNCSGLALRRESGYFSSMSTHEILLEEIKHLPEPVLRELRHYLDVLKRQRETESPMDGVVADTWEKLGPAPEIDYDRL